MRVLMRAREKGRGNGEGTRPGAANRLRHEDGGAWAKSRRVNARLEKVVLQEIIDRPIEVGKVGSKRQVREPRRLWW